MITGELRSKIDRIWDDFWSGGISNPLTANMNNTSIENPVFPQDRSFLRWSRFKDMEARDIFE